MQTLRVSDALPMNSNRQDDSTRKSDHFDDLVECVCCQSQYTCAVLFVSLLVDFKCYLTVFIRKYILQYSFVFNDRIVQIVFVSLLVDF